jgi:hypothetical protein
MKTRSGASHIPIKSIYNKYKKKWIILSTSLTDHDINNVKKNRTYTRIFNPDEKRLQSDLSESEPIIQNILETIKDYLNGRTLGPIVLLHSLQGCKKQRFHWDYDPNLLKSDKPLGVLVALDDDTIFYTLDKKIELKCGDILIFDGDLVHAGGDYTQDNYRIHLYLDVNYKCRDINKTYFFLNR